MALDTLEVFGTEYLNVKGFKAKNDSDQTLAYVRPQGTLTISQNGSGIDVSEYASVDVSVSGGGSSVSLQSLTVTPSSTQQVFNGGLVDVEVLSLSGNANQFRSGAYIYHTISRYSSISNIPLVVGETYHVSGSFSRKGRGRNYSVDTDIEWTSSGATIVWSEIGASRSINMTFENGQAVVNLLFDVGSNEEDDTDNPFSMVFTQAKQVDGYVPVTVEAIPAQEIKTQSKTATPTESVQTITPDTGYDGLSSVEVGAINSTYVGTGVDRTTSEDIIQGYGLGTYRVAIPSGYVENSFNVTVPSGSASVANENVDVSCTITVSASGLISASGSDTHTVTPSINAGYIAEGTSGTLTLSTSSTRQLDTQAAVTATPTKSEQTIVTSGKYTTGAIKVAAIPNAYQDVSSVDAVAADVVSGKKIVDASGNSITGSLVIQHYYTGTTEPSSSLGEDGDIYLMTGA